MLIQSLRASEMVSFNKDKLTSTIVSLGFQ